MRYLRYNAIVAAIFLVIGGLTVFVPLPDGLGFVPIFILVAMLASFLAVSFLSIPQNYEDSVFAMALCFVSSAALSGFVVLATMMMVVAVHGCL